MTLKLFYLAAICLISSQTCISQNYYITMRNDSVPCKDIIGFSTNVQGKMVELEYIDKNGNMMKQKKSEIPEIRTICQGGVIYDRMPLTLKKPDSYYRYGERAANGKIRVNVYDNQTTNYHLKKNFDGTSTNQMTSTTSGTYLRHVKMPDGTIHELSGLKGMKSLKIIREYMFECKKFEQEVNSNPKYQSCTFEEMVRDYNKLCSAE